MLIVQFLDQVLQQLLLLVVVRGGGRFNSGSGATVHNSETGGSGGGGSSYTNANKDSKIIVQGFTGGEGKNTQLILGKD